MFNFFFAVLYQIITKWSRPTAKVLPENLLLSKNPIPCNLLNVFLRIPQFNMSGKESTVFRPGNQVRDRA